MRKATIILTFILFGGFQILYGQVNITGRVTTDVDGSGLTGASITVPGTTIGTITVDGNYSITVPANTKELVFSYVGMKSQTVSIEGKSIINVTLEEEITQLEDVVVVGYGVQVKTTVTGAVSDIQTKELIQSPQANISNAVVGRMTGLLTVQREGEPGQNATELRIRGQGTFSGSSEPLIMVDGIEAVNWNNIDPNEIENISVLKDASATAVYGVRGANGVIIITTKRGQEGKPTLNFSANYGINVWQDLIQNVPSYPYTLAYNEARRYDSYITGSYLPKFSEEQIAAYKSGDDPIFYPDTDWMDLFFKPAAAQSQMNFNIRGGTDKIKYFVSAGYFNQEAGFSKELTQSATSWDAQHYYRRYNLRSNFDFTITKRLSASVNLSSQMDKNKGSDTNWVLDKVYNMPPWTSPGLVDGKIVNVYEIYGGAILENFLGSGYQTNFNNYLTSSIRVNYDLDFITKGLKIHSTISYWNLAGNTRNYNKGIQTYKPFKLPDNSIIYAPQNDDEPFGYWESGRKNKKDYMEVGLNYSRSFGNHNVTGLFLYNQDKLYDPSLAFNIPNGHQGLVGRLTYNYSLRYMAEFNIGYNGTENFAVGKRFGVFPAFSVGWVVSEESFFPTNKFVNYLKFRATYGEVGNDRIGGQRFLYRPSSYIFGNISNNFQPTEYNFGVPGSTFQTYQGVYQGVPGNTGLTWERAEKSNLGADINLFGNMLRISGDYFYEHRNNILSTPNTTPNIFGSELPPQNWGEMENQGFELEVNFRDAVGDFNYWIKGVYTYAHNKILFQDEVDREWAYQQRTGQSRGQFFGYVYQGFYNTWDEVNDAVRPQYQENSNNIMPGDCIYKDINGDGVINSDDTVPMGYSNFPEINYGLSFGVEYKGFDVSVLFQGADNFNRLAGSRNWAPFNWESAINQYVFDHSWTPERLENGADITLPHLTAEGTNRSNYLTSNLWLQDSRYLRLKNLEIGYAFSNNLLKRAGISNARIYTNGHNLLTWDGLFPYSDPENFTSGGNEGYYPITRTMNLGINVTF